MVSPPWGRAWFGVIDVVGRDVLAASQIIRHGLRVVASTPRADGPLFESETVIARRPKADEAIPRSLIALQARRGCFGPAGLAMTTVIDAPWQTPHRHPPGIAGTPPGV
jgi:hypothetical protein